MAKPALILVGADKGGVGKTTVARTLLDYFTAHNVPTRAFDTETPKGTLKRFHRDVSEVVDATGGRRSDAHHRHAVDDRRVGHRCRRARRINVADAARSARYRLSRSGQKGQITFVVFHILGSSIASLNEIEETAPFTTDAEYFLVKNFINNTNFFEWDQATPCVLLQEAEGRRRRRDPETQRNGVRAGGTGFCSVPDLCCQQGRQERDRQLFVRAARLRQTLAPGETARSVGDGSGSDARSSAPQPIHSKV
jgi:hypothetical protein